MAAKLAMTATACAVGTDHAPKLAKSGAAVQRTLAHQSIQAPAMPA